jgi:hypothetical protein
MIALAVLVAPLALFGLFHKTRLHYVGIQYTSPDGKSSGILLQADKDNYRSMLVALQGVTGAPVSVSEKERSFIPVGVTATVAKSSEDAKAASAAPPAPLGTPTEAAGTISLNSNPDGAEIYVDDQFYGNSPATLKLKPGKHTIRVKMSGYNDWLREVSSDAGAATRLIATLEKATL